MKKLLLTVICALMGWAALTPEAQALKDKEHVQKVLKKADIHVKQGMIVYEKGQEYKREMTDKLNGAKGFISAVKEGDITGALDAADTVAGDSIGGETGAIRDNISGATGAVDGAVSGVKGAVGNVKNKVPGMISNVNNPEQTREDVSKAYYGQYGEGNDVGVFNDQNEKTDAIQRENIADMYARALTGRVAIAKEKADGEKEIDTSDTRQLINATRNKAMQTAERLRKILVYEASIYQFQTAAKAKAFQNIDGAAQLKASAEDKTNAAQKGGKS